MKGLSYTIAIGIVFAAPYAIAQSAEQVVEAQGTASVQSDLAIARQTAIADAVRSAVERIMGAYVSSSVSFRSSESSNNDAVASSEQFQQRILKRADGFGKVLSVISESRQGNLYTVLVRVAVSRGPLEQELKAFLARKGDPRIIVLIPEVIIRNPVPDPAAETEIMRSLIAAGYRVVDAGQAQRLNERDRIQAGGLDAQAMRDVATRFQADLLVTGEAFAEEVSNPPAELRQSGMLGFGSRLEIKVVDLATAQIIYSNAFHAGAVGPSAALAGKTALTNAAKLAVGELPKTLLNWMSGSGKGAGRTFSVRINQVPGFRALSELSATLRNAAGVRSVLSRQFDSGGALLEVEYDGSPEDLATLLEDLHLSVTGLSAGEVNASFRP